MTSHRPGTAETFTKLVSGGTIRFGETPDRVLQLLVLLPDPLLHLRQTLLHPPGLGNSASDVFGLVIHNWMYSNPVAART